MQQPAESEADLALIEAAREVIRRNYDAVCENHTVGSAVRCADGRVFVGVNVHSLHGTCAEFVAIGAAICEGEREFESLVAVRGADGEEVLPPCGNCRQMLNDYAPDCLVFVPGDDGPVKVRATDLLPHAYSAEHDSPPEGE